MREVETEDSKTIFIQASFFFSRCIIFDRKDKGVFRSWTGDSETDSIFEFATVILPST